MYARRVVLPLIHVSYYRHSSVCFCSTNSSVNVQELEDMELRLRHGGLGGVSNSDRWDKRLSAAKTIKDFVSHL
jgi:hypothetical protein